MKMEKLLRGKELVMPLSGYLIHTFMVWEITLPFGRERMEKRKFFMGIPIPRLTWRILEETEDGTVIAEGCNDYTITVRGTVIFSSEWKLCGKERELYLDG